MTQRSARVAFAGGALMAVDFGDEPLLVVQFAPNDHFALFKRCRHVDDPLIRRSAELQERIVQRLDVAAVDEDVDFEQ